ncbi:hypothetical protein C8J56DRAFT_1103341 [Mycena floridula]|nr:hypothetical protein C8J56DRAFT_1103341 [Mycena floridula]
MKEQEYQADLDEFNKEASVDLGPVLYQEELPQGEEGNNYEPMEGPIASIYIFEQLSNEEMVTVKKRRTNWQAQHIGTNIPHLRFFRMLGTNFLWSPHYPQREKLRQLRAYVHDMLDSLVRAIIKPKYRDILDHMPENHPLKHYFQHHCVFFRIIEKDMLPILQGFNVNCYHLAPPGTNPEDGAYVEGRLITREAHHTPINPFILPEEDEFLFHCAALFDHLGYFADSNRLRQVRAQAVIRSDPIRDWLRRGYLQVETTCEVYQSPSNAIFVGSHRLVHYIFKVPRDLAYAPKYLSTLCLHHFSSFPTLLPAPVVYDSGVDETAT